MVKLCRTRNFFRDTSGVVLTEALISFPIMILAFAVIIEFGFLVHQWNLGAKAMHLGVRKLVVSGPVSPDFNTVFAFNAAQGNDLIPANAGVRSTCGAGTAAPCNVAAMARLVDGTPGSMWPGLAQYYPGLQVDEIRVIYELSGLGYNGRPTGPVVTVRMELQRAPTNMLFVGALLGLAGVNFPPFAVSTTSEDLQSCPGGCATGL